MNSALRILFIDDTPEDRALAKLVLVRESPDLELKEITDAIGFAQELVEGKFDLVFTEHRVQWADGMAILRAVKSRYPNCPVIMFTGSGSAELAVEAIKAGGDDYVLKSPKNYIRLPEIVRSALERVRQREAKKEAENRHQSLFEGLPVAIYRTTPMGGIVYANQVMLKMLDYANLQELKAVNIADFYVSPEMYKQWQCLMESEGIVRDFEAQVRRRDGTVLWVRNNARPVRDDEGRVLYFDETLEDITELKKSGEQIKTSLKEKEVLLKEIYHRVKNNFQVISSLLNLQSGYIKDKEALEIFKKTQNRIQSMALIHEKMYQAEDLDRIDFGEYIRNLTAHLFRSYGIDSEAITLKLNVEKVFLSIDTAIPCGLIINELVSNALKHAFPEGEQGEISIDLRADEDKKYTLIMSDNGVGLPKDFDLRNTQSLGLQLVKMLTDQLEGTIEIDSRKGTKFKLTFQDVRQKESV